MKTRERGEARRLRHERGLSIKAIATALGVSQSSVSVWVRDVRLSPEQRAALARATTAGQLRGVALRSEHARCRRRTYQAEGRAHAARGDPVHAAGVMLFWAEGAKRRNAACVSNSDPELLRTFMRFVRATFDVPDRSLRVTCHLFPDHREHQAAIEEHWLRCLSLPRSCLTKSIVNAHSRNSRLTRAGALPYGTTRLCVHSTRVAQHIYGAIQEYGGFERPEWLG